MPPVHSQPDKILLNTTPIRGIMKHKIFCKICSKIPKYHKDEV